MARPDRAERDATRLSATPRDESGQGEARSLSKFHAGGHLGGAKLGSIGQGRATLDMTKCGTSGLGGSEHDKARDSHEMTKPTRAIPEVSLDTQTLERLLLSVAVGDTIGYDVLTTAIGRDVQHAARHNLVSARRRVLRSERMVFEPVVNVGMKRLDDAGKIGAGRWHLRRSRNQARYAIQKTTAVDHFELLTNDQKVEHNVIVAQAGVLRHLTSPKSTAKLAGKIETPRQALPLRDCLKAMEPCL